MTASQVPANPLCGCPETPYGTHHRVDCQTALDYYNGRAS